MLFRQNIKKFKLITYFMDLYPLKSSEKEV